MEIHTLLNRNIYCTCGQTHRCNIGIVQIGTNALDSLIPAVEPYRSILLVADRNTYPICGEHVKNLLGHKLTMICLFETTDLLIPNEDAIKRLESHLQPETDLILGIGSGVINDLCKYVSFFHGCKSGIIATAPSMDGYASSGAAMLLSGMKVTLTTHAPDIIIGDTDILKTAPISMIRSGYGDIIGKYSSLCDWELANLICAEHICRPIYDLVMRETIAIRDCATEIMARENYAIEKLMRALVLIGITLTLVETTRPGSGSEHHLSHFYEIIGLLRNEKHFTHGTDVAYNTVLTAAMREQICKMEHPCFCEESFKKRIEAWTRIYGPLKDEIIQLQQEAGNYNKDFKSIYTEKWNEIKAVLSKCPTAAECNCMMEQVGLHISEYETLYTPDKIRDAMLYGKDLKNRYSVLWLYYTIFSGDPKASDYKHFPLKGDMA